MSSVMIDSVYHGDSILNENQGFLFNLDNIQRTIYSMNIVTPKVEEDTLKRDTSIDPGKSDIPELNTFQSS